MFDTIHAAHLHIVLETADTITTPADWAVDHSTGVLSLVPFSACVDGPDVEASLLCRTAYDFDSDADVDLRDFATYQEKLGFSSP